MAVTLPEVEAAYQEIANADREGREPNLSGFSQEIQDYVITDPMVFPTEWGQRRVADVQAEVTSSPKPEAKDD